MHFVTSAGNKCPHCSGIAGQSGVSCSMEPATIVYIEKAKVENLINNNNINNNNNRRNGSF